MKISIIRTTILSALFLLLVVFFCSCATVGYERASKESLSSAAARYWDLRMAGKLDETYKMEAREGLPGIEVYREQAGKIRGMLIDSYNVKDSVATGDKGTVSVEFRLLFNGGPPKPIIEVLKDSWVFKDGVWLHMFR